MTHVTYFRISLFFPLIIGAVLGFFTLLGYVAFSIKTSPGVLADLWLFILIFTVGHVYIAIPYIIFALILGIKVSQWSVKKTIIFILYTQIIFLIIATLIGSTLDVAALAAIVSAISSIFYVSLILGLYFLGKKLGWIVNVGK